PNNPSPGITYYQNTIVGMAKFCNDFLAQTNLTGNAAGVAQYENTHSIPGIKVINSQTIEIQLTKPASDFVDLVALTYASAVPVEDLQYVSGSPASFNHLLSDGPYKITSYQPGQQILLDRNAAWKQSSDPIRHQYVKRIQVTEGQPNFQS